MAQSTIQEAITILKPFIGQAQLQTMAQLANVKETAFLKGKLHELANMVETLPKPFETQKQGDKAVATLKYTHGGCVWYVVEKDESTNQNQAYGLVDKGYGLKPAFISILTL